MKYVLAAILSCFFIQPAFAQLERQRVADVIEVELTFPTPRHISLHTNEPLAKGELYYSIMHTFGTVENGVSDFWGIDRGANVRFSLEYGFSDRFSAFIGRSSMDKIYESGFRLHLLRQMTDDSVPVSLSLIATGGIITEDFTFLGVEMSFSERLIAGISLPVSRKFDDRLSLMISPMFSVFSETNDLMRIEDEADRFYYGLGTGARYKLGNRTSITLQYTPSYRHNAEKVSQNFGLGLDYETGGHVFQIFLTTSQSLNDPYLLAGANGNIQDYGFRFGFNINRSFMVR